MENITDNSSILFGVFDALDETITSLRALNNMLNICLESDGGALQTDANGIYWLFRQQIDDLDILQKTIHDGVKEMRVNLFQQKDPTKAARAFSVDIDTVIGIIRMMTGADVSNYANHNTQKATTESNAALIAEKLKDGVKAGPIAQELNMKQATVERVIAQLVPEEPDLIPIIDKAAVNG